MLKTDYLEVKEHGTPPPTPPSGSLRIYGDTSGNFKVKNDGGSESTLGGGGASSGAMADIPAAGTAGRLYLPNNYPMQFVDTGSAWVNYSPSLQVLTPPVAADYGTWVNQDSTTLTSPQQGVQLVKASQGGANSHSFRVKSTPAAPYTVTAKIRPVSVSVAAGYFSAGIYLRQSSDGKMAHYSIQHDQSNLKWQWYAQKFSSATAYVSDIYSSGANIYPQINSVWIQVVDDNTNRIFMGSYDGVFFFPLFSEARTTYYTADQVGFGINNYSSGANATIVVEHFAIT